MLIKQRYIYLKNGNKDKLYVSENNVDKISIFPNYVPHFTTEHTQDDERITLAFDLIPRYNNYCNL